MDATPKAPYSLDANLYHTSYESGVLENPMNGPPKDMFRMTVDPVGHSCTLNCLLQIKRRVLVTFPHYLDAPNVETFLRIEFVSGVPTKVLNKSTGVEKTDPLEAFVFLNEGTFIRIPTSSVNCLSDYFLCCVGKLPEPMEWAGSTSSRIVSWVLSPVVCMRPPLVPSSAKRTSTWRESLSTVRFALFIGYLSITITCSLTIRNYALTTYMTLTNNNGNEYEYCRR